MKKLRLHVPKVVVRTIVSIVVLAVLFAGGGIAYVYYSGKYVKPTSPAVKAETTPAEPVIPKPVAPGPNAPEGVALQAISSPVKVGSNASIDITTNATSACAILVTYNEKPSTDSGLSSKVADAYGRVSWTWTVGSSVPAGSWPVKVTCVYHGRSGVLINNIQVTK